MSIRTRTESLMTSRFHSANGGFSERYSTVEVVGPKDVYTSEPLPENAVQIIERSIGGRTVFHAEPIHQPEGLVGPMASGAYITIDSSKGEYPHLVGFYGAIPLHDRFETQELYDALSR